MLACAAIVCVTGRNWLKTHPYATHATLRPFTVCPSRYRALLSPQTMALAATSIRSLIPVALTARICFIWLNVLYVFVSVGEFLKK